MAPHLRAQDLLGRSGPDQALEDSWGQGGDSEPKKQMTGLAQVSLP